MNPSELLGFAALLDESARATEERERQAQASRTAGAAPQLAGTTGATGPSEAAGGARGARNASGVPEGFADGYEAPEYEISYKQTVSASEVYGGFQGVSPSAADSDTLVVTIQLPGERPGDVDLRVGPTSLTLYARRHRLYLELPDRVREKGVHARFSQGALRVEMRREDAPE